MEHYRIKASTSSWRCSDGDLIWVKSSIWCNMNSYSNVTLLCLRRRLWLEVRQAQAMDHGYFGCARMPACVSTSFFLFSVKRLACHFNHFNCTPSPPPCSRLLSQVVFIFILVAHTTQHKTRLTQEHQGPLLHVWGLFVYFFYLSPWTTVVYSPVFFVLVLFCSSILWRKTILLR